MELLRFCTYLNYNEPYKTVSLFFYFASNLKET